MGSLPPVLGVSLFNDRLGGGSWRMWWWPQLHVGYKMAALVYELPVSPSPRRVLIVKPMAYILDDR